MATSESMLSWSERGRENRRNVDEAAGSSGAGAVHRHISPIYSTSENWIWFD